MKTYVKYILAEMTKLINNCKEDVSSAWYLYEMWHGGFRIHKQKLHSSIRSDYGGFYRLYWKNSKLKKRVLTADDIVFITSDSGISHYYEATNAALPSFNLGERLD